MITYTDCKECGGRGSVQDGGTFSRFYKCKKCKGKGQFQKPHTIELVSLTLDVHVVPRKDAKVVISLAEAVITKEVGRYVWVEPTGRDSRTYAGRIAIADLDRVHFDASPDQSHIRARVSIVVDPANVKKGATLVEELRTKLNLCIGTYRREAVARIDQLDQATHQVDQTRTIRMIKDAIKPKKKIKA